MSIRTQSLFDSKRAKFGAEAATTKFTNVFFDALRSVKGDMEIKCLLDFDVPGNLRTNIELDEKYWSVVSLGLDYHICTHGEWLLDDPTTVDRRYKQALKTARMAAQKDAATTGKLGSLS